MGNDRFTISTTKLDGVKVITRKKMGDSRGFLMRMYCTDELATAGLIDPIVQINCTMTARQGTIRGMHFQNAPAAEAKCVSVLDGEILDIAVDIRQGSPTFLQWHGEKLSGDNCRSLYIPKGLAHGFQTLTPDCTLLYLHTTAYTADAEGGLNPLDKRLAIHWPLPVTEMSPRDRQHSDISDRFMGIAI